MTRLTAIMFALFLAASAHAEDGVKEADYVFSINNSFGIAGIDNFSKMSGLLWNLEVDIRLHNPHLILSPYVMVSKARLYKGLSDYADDVMISSQWNYSGTGLNLKYSPFGPGVFELLVIAGVSAHVFGDDGAVGPTLGVGAYINPFAQMAIVLDATYTLTFGGETHMLGVGGAVFTGGLAFRF